MRSLNPFRMLCVTLFIVLAGCESIDSRIAAHESEFLTLSSDEQARIRVGEIELGDTPATVLIARGKPNHRDTLLLGNGKTRTTWTYSTTQYIKTGSRLGKIDRQRNTAEVAHVFRVLERITLQVSFIADRVVQVRDPVREAQAIASLGNYAPSFGETD